MSLYILVTDTLVGDPARRSGAKGDFATATIRVATDDGAILASAIAFGDGAEQLLGHRQSDTVAAAGRGRLTEWTGRDGEQHHGLSLVVDQIASAASARRADAGRRRSPHQAQPEAQR